VGAGCVYVCVCVFVCVCMWVCMCVCVCVCVQTSAHLCTNKKGVMWGLCVCRDACRAPPTSPLSSCRRTAASEKPPRAHMLRTSPDSCVCVCVRVVCVCVCLRGGGVRAFVCLLVWKVYVCQCVRAVRVFISVCVFVQVECM